MAAGTGLQTLPQFGRVAPDELGEAEVFDVAKSFAAQDARLVSGGSKKDSHGSPRAAALLRHRHQAGAALGRLVLEWLGVVEARQPMPGTPAM